MTSREDTPEDQSFLDFDYDAAEERYQKVCNDLEGNIAMEDFVCELVNVHKALTAARRTEEMLREHNLKLDTTLQADSARVEQALLSATQAMQDAERMREAMENAFRRVDAAHAREHQAQEALGEAERQLAQLRQSLEQRNQAVLESDELSTVPRSQDEQRQDRERLTRELTELRVKLANATTAYDEMEKKNMAAGAKMDNMAQHLEILSGELSKEVGEREALESEHQAHAALVTSREEVISRLEVQLREAKQLICKLEHADKESKGMCERLSSEVELLTGRCHKYQRDYEAQLLKVERFARENVQKTAALKASEEEIGHVKQDAARFVKAKELYVKRATAAESARSDVERERDELKALILERDRESERLRKQRDTLKKRLDELARDKQLIAKNLTKTADMKEQQAERSKWQEKLQQTLTAQIQHTEEQLSEQNQRVKKLERQCEKLRAESARKMSEIEAVCDQLRHKHEEAVRCRREALEVSFRQQHQLALLETVRGDKESAERQLVTYKAQVARLEEKLRDVEQKSCQLKASISAHEAATIHNQLALQRAERERESARHELRQAREQLNTFRERATLAEQQHHNLQEQLQQASKQCQASQVGLEQVEARHKDEKKLLASKSEDICELEAQLKHSQLQQQNSQIQYHKRIEDLRLLKIEIQNLRQEKSSLVVNIGAMVDARDQVFRLQRDLTKEQLKCKALEEELARPRNVHRWRYLQGEDPERYDLLQRLALSQRHMLAKASKQIPIVHGPRDTLSAPPEKLQPSAEMLYQIRHKTKQIKALEAERTMHQSQLENLRNEINQLGSQLQEAKRTIFTQKSQLHRAKRHKLAVSSATDETCAIVLHPPNNLPPSTKQRCFTGGGFNLNVTPQDSRLPDTP